MAFAESKIKNKNVSIGSSRSEVMSDDRRFCEILRAWQIQAQT
ncbi:hypothetical protein COLO4_20719 [Corchorus olitorius]|uniref:Uncharacterized protein n=1 Tax=Corchorus olitorius TaxID=93759 RepID=A0A1R3IXE8_9ROSI|nr:hypothetical protein COLO4_20719 [Corchorus olitorius]